ncbi:Histone-lysine N-methyltransferase ash1 [Trachymyrmex septentrionalis]|uniref:Histone-lysine N-methyltransferase ash1 n=1 Tax=Trachymyrmex septentrionalis TaxID=34720 RepID=A0A195FL69_9HYME|nr:Histone-lysine N-methyltransferase ash1 [Trachymyrmex septentrionalis]
MSGDAGWNAVIHHPSDLELQDWNWEENDGEQEKELPSTVDMDAIKGGGSWDPATEPNGTDSVDSEEDSDSDDESSGGSEGSCSYSDSNSESDDESSGDEEEESGSNSDCSSEHSEQTFSIQETNFEPGALKLKITMKGPKKEDSEKIKCDKSKKTVSKKLKTNNHGNKSSECSSEDSDSSVVGHAASQKVQQQQSQQHQHHHAPLQEINQEDLATVLPSQVQEDAPFDGFEDSESGRLVSKAIERMSLGADSDTSENGDQNPVPVYSSTLLQQFVEKTAMLSEPRKRRSKCAKKLNNDNEYPCVSNVSPDSGIQSVDNSPLHLAISPVSPPAPTQSPTQPPISTKPAVNVDRVLYPPKRKPGRPAKTVSTQPRGPGRPRLKPEIVEKIQKIEKAEKEKNEPLKSPESLKNLDSRLTEKKATVKESSMKSAKENTVLVRKRGNAKSVASREVKEDASPASKRIKGKMTAYQKKRYGNTMKSSQEKTVVKKTAGTSSPMRVKCLSRSTANKLALQCDSRTCRKVRQDKTCAPNKTPLTRQKQMSCEHQPTNDQKMLSTSKRTGSKENRNNATTVVSRKLAKKVSAPPTTRRVLKENKCNKKTTAAGFKTNGVGVQTLISLPVGNVLKAENVERASNKYHKPMQPIQHNYCHKHHHHKHRRRLLAPPKTPIRIDPCIIQELEKLIEEFTKFLGKNNNNNNNGNSVVNHSELPQIFRVKKLTKKRKGGDISANDDQKLKRRLKKEKILTSADSKSSANTSTSSNPNEQRLPLKKRHYHVSSPHSSQSSNASCTDANANESNSTESHIEEAIEATITRYGGGSSTFSIHDEEAMPVTPKKRPRDTENTTSEKHGSDEDKPISQIEIQPRRKKKIVKDLRVTVTKLSAESHSLLDKDKSADKTQVGNLNVPNLANNTAAMILTKKKIRRRKAINRTGFPTLKKKKKKQLVDSTRVDSTKSTVNANGVCKDQDIVEHTEDNKASLTESKAQNVIENSNGPVRNRKKQQKWKKLYLQASNIFSEYKKNLESKKLTNVDAKRKLIVCANSDEHPSEQLPNIIPTGKLLRQRKTPFQLQYDLLWLHAQSRLSGRDLVPSWNYKKIRTNIYYDVKPTTLYEAQACECKQESGCGDDCINRMVFSECSPQLCPCGDKCENQKIQKHEWSPGLQRFMTEDKGWGVRTQQAIKSGDFILEYVGEVVSEREFKSRMATRYANDTHHYCLHLDGGLVIDGHRMGGDGRFVNHSCEPNCEMQKWSVLGLPRMALFASRDIKPGEELTYDYNFALFNPSEGQQCRCGSNACRGVIGGKSQRVARSVPSLPSQMEPIERRSVGRPRKNIRKSNAVQSANSKNICKSRKVGDPILTHNTPQLKPMSYQQRCFAREHHCFLLRNLEKVRRLKSASVQQVQIQNGKAKSGNTVVAKEKSSGDSKAQSDAFFSQLTALTNTNARTVRTRRLAQAQDDPEVHKTAKLATVLKNLYTIVTTANDENGQLLCIPFMTLPSKRKLSDYYEKIVEPIDLITIDQCIGTGHYKTAEHFDQDMIKLFDNNVRFFGRTSEIGIAAARLRKLYLGSKPDFVDAITEATGSPPSQGFLPPRGSTAGEEDVIRCICGLHRDEGLMIQCERCLVWQHCDCVKADTSVESYLCERCQPREVDLEIPLEGEEEEEDKKHYVTLMRGDLQLRQGDTVYVLRDTPDKHTYKTIQKPDYEQMDIFRIERLWKNHEGDRFVFGHHYLRPHETYHEPTRKFYVNEVVCAPLYEAVPCDLVAERCWVLDPHTFCKGRPVGSTPEHTYVCEYRVDRAARLFTKVARTRHTVCTKPYAFETFPQRIKHYRTYLPHSLDGIKMFKDKKKNNNQEVDGNQKLESNDNTKTHNKEHKCNKTRRKSGEILTVASPATSYAQLEEQRKKLNRILLNLLQRMPNKKDPLDLSFLLERNRRNRKRPGGLNP